MTTTAKASLPHGDVVFREEGGGGRLSVHIDVCDAWLSDGEHGFHIHERGDTTFGCGSMGGHYNPDGHDHGSRTSSRRHVGDLGNVVSKNGCISHTLWIDGIEMKDVVGRGVVVHALADDLGMGVGELREESKKTGNSGARLMCAPIVWAVEE